MKGEADPLAEYPNLRRWLGIIDGRPAIEEGRLVAIMPQSKNTMNTRRVPCYLRVIPRMPERSSPRSIARLEQNGGPNNFTCKLDCGQTRRNASSRSIAN